MEDRRLERAILNLKESVEKIKDISEYLDVDLRSGKLMDFKEFTEKAKEGKGFFAGNRFDSFEQAVKYIQTFYNIGAKKVEVVTSEWEEKGVKVIGGDTLYVTFDWGIAPPDFYLFADVVKKGKPDEFSMEKENLYRLWWD